ncbi:hypothetical protein B0J11DRAFT_491058 [Dendryphion nanum]|uniref:Uncharacterized protein n=1 Tax=Dendryphion nanum TaxID=256645 RepID=A0A9P9DLH1_9PLEO|nr:hypothetical protein B0J11DRAFT_491058 [Dendryphion nanum]
MAGSPISNTVYTGVWKNWDERSHMSGLTLTVSPNQGPILISFLALFVGVASGHIWPLVTFVLHQVRSTASDRDGLHHQIQSLLRNSSSSPSFIWMVTRLNWAWRKRTPRWRKTTMVGFPALVHILFTAFASIFSAQMTLFDDEVLARGTACGAIYDNSLAAFQNATTRQDAIVATNTIGRWTAEKALQYTKTCYDTVDLAGSASCKLYTTPKITPIRNNTIPCPFGKNICSIPTGISIDTDIVDSNKHLGINDRPEDRIQFRKVLTCSPILAEEQYSSDWKDDPNESPEFASLRRKFKTYSIGKNNRVKDFDGTWKISNQSLWLRTAGYDLRSLESYWGYQDSPETSAFSPIPELNTSDSDLTILIIQSTIGYTNEVLDPWFKATRKNNSELINSTYNYINPFNDWASTKISFFPDRINSALACTEQYQFCNTTHCSHLTGIFANETSPYFNLHLNANQKVSFNVIFNAVFGVMIGNGPFFFGDRLLLARDKAWAEYTPVSGPLPPNQWEMEVANMANLMLAAVQRRIVDYASPPDIPLFLSTGSRSSLEWLRPPETDAEKRICGLVRIRNAAYYNFSVGGILTVFCVGLFVILVSTLCLPGAAFWAGRKMGRGEFAQREWKEGHLLYLLRSGFERWGVGPWVVEEEDIPCTKDGGLRFGADRLWGSGGDCEEGVGNMGREEMVNLDEVNPLILDGFSGCRSGEMEGLGVDHGSVRR